MKAVQAVLVGVLMVSLAACSREQGVAESSQVQEPVSVEEKIDIPVQEPAQAAEALLIDDFEGEVSGGMDGTFDYGAGNGAQVAVSAAMDIKHSGDQSIQVTYDAPADGYMWVARGFGLDAARTAWSVKNDQIAWEDYSAFSFYIYGTGSGAEIAFDLKDGGNEMWRFMFTDDTAGWKQIVAPFSSFFVRDDWQPDAADKNEELDFPVKSFQFEPRPISSGTLYFDTVELIKQ